MGPLNPALTEMGAYPSKRISEAAKRDPRILNLSIGEPHFGPPAALLDLIANEDLRLDTFLSAVKSYETSRGAQALREAIAHWYQRRYDLTIDPAREILITHGGSEALALALLSCTCPNDAVAITDPSYLLYDRSVRTLGRQPVRFSRPACDEEYLTLSQTEPRFATAWGGAKALIVNSPENPTGYVLSHNEWQLLNEIAQQHHTWLIHDEVYDSMAYGRQHYPARHFDVRGERTILVNSCSKKFGVPGLRIGWLVARAEVIDAASKAHDYLLLGVNRQYEHIATRLLNDTGIDHWLDEQRALIEARALRARQQLTLERGYAWPRQPQGGMFLFPDVSALCTRWFDHTEKEQTTATRGEKVAQRLLDECHVATVPGLVYGACVENHVRLVLCTDERTFDTALDRLTHAGEGRTL